jgi:hypothetical protein
MPFLDAKALENDPDGMVFLRSVIRPTFEQEEDASLRKELRQRFEAVQLPEEPQAEPALLATALPLAVS